jgi:YesN/AraC family two-component response regulator
VREALVAALAPRYEVRTAATASAALDGLCTQPFDLILLDHRLPDLPGTDVLKLVKRFFPSTTDVFRDVGFKDMTHFGRVFKKLEGLLPSEFRRRTGNGGSGGPSQPGPENSSS